MQVSNQSKSSHLTLIIIKSTQQNIKYSFQNNKINKIKKINNNDLYNESIEFNNKSNYNNKSNLSSINVNNDFKIRIRENYNNEPIYKKYNFLFDDDKIDTNLDGMQEKNRKTMNSKLRYNYEILVYINYIIQKVVRKPKEK